MEAALIKLDIPDPGNSGKSSFFLSLLRLLDIQTGSLEVDDVDVSRTPLCTVRRRCFIAVPQDPFILPHASVRFNLDPYNEHNDTALCQALERTGLSSHFSTSMSEERGDSHDMPDSDIFHRALNTFPPLSTGQMQMLAFAQALLRAQPSARITDPLIIQRKPILILDEASSSLDLETEAQMQELLQQEFTKNGHTVIIIAHRLNHVMKDMRPGLDGVVLVDDGKMEVHG